MHHHSRAHFTSRMKVFTSGRPGNAAAPRNGGEIYGDFMGKFRLIHKGIYGIERVVMVVFMGLSLMMILGLWFFFWWFGWLFFGHFMTVNCKYSGDIMGRRKSAWHNPKINWVHLGKLPTSGPTLPGWRLKKHLKNMNVNWGDGTPNMWKKTNLPNHQPASLTMTDHYIAPVTSMS